MELYIADHPYSFSPPRTPHPTDSYIHHESASSNQRNSNLTCRRVHQPSLPTLVIGMGPSDDQIRGGDLDGETHVHQYYLFLSYINSSRHTNSCYHPQIEII